MSVLLQRMRIFVFRRAGTGRSKGSAVHNRRHDSGNSSPGCDMLKQIMRARRAYWMQAGLPALPIFHTMNKHIKSLWLLPVAGLSLSLMPSCTTDSYGNSTVTPGGAAASAPTPMAAAPPGVTVRWPPGLPSARRSSMTATRTGIAMTGIITILRLRRPVRPTAPIGGGKGKPMARKSCGAPALQEERGATWYFRSPVGSQDWRMPRSAQVMRCLALSGSLRMEPSRSSTGRTAFGSCTWSCPERIKGAPPQQTR